MFTEEFAILGKIPLKIVRIKSQQTKSNFKWWFGSLSQSFFSSATQIIIRFCTGPNHHYFPSDRLYSLIGVITSLATLWLVRLSLTLQCWLVVWLFSTMDFQMCLQRACIRGCIITMVAFVWLFTTVSLQMCPQMACMRRCIITQVTFVWLFSTVGFQMCPQTVCPRGCIITLVAFVWLFSTVCFQMSPQIACLNGCKVTLVAFVWLFTTVYFQMCPQMTCIRGCIYDYSHIGCICLTFLHCVL